MHAKVCQYCGMVIVGVAVPYQNKLFCTALHRKRWIERKMRQSGMLRLGRKRVK